MRRSLTTLAALAALVLCANSAGAATITFTGDETDFTTAGVLPIASDGVDTQAFDCGSGPVHPLDLDRVYITNDASDVYIGFTYRRFCFCDINLGLAFHTGPGGTSSDPFARQITWALSPQFPDFYVYDVIPTNCNGFNYEVLYRADGAGGWATVRDGSNGLGMVDTDGGNFVELKLSHADLGVGCLTSFFDIFFEIHVTQEGGTKPAFDFIVNDSQQQSTPGGTNFDVDPGESPSMPVEYLRYRLECPVAAQPTSWGAVKSIYR